MSMDYRALEAENARVSAALTDAVAGLNEMAKKLVAAGMAIGFHADESVYDIAEKCRLHNAELARLREENARLKKTAA